MADFETVHDALDHTGLTGIGSAQAPWALMPYFGGAGHEVVGVGANNRAIYVPMEPLQAAATVTGVRISIGTSSGNICVAMYDSAGSRVATSGAVASPGTGLRDIAFTGSYAASAGRYYLAISADNTTVTFVASANTNASPASCRYEESAHPLPATATFNAAVTGRGIVLVGRISGSFP